MERILFGIGKFNHNATIHNDIKGAKIDLAETGEIVVLSYTNQCQKRIDKQVCPDKKKLLINDAYSKVCNEIFASDDLVDLSILNQMESKQ
ncbi:MAG: hypothetical protein ACPHY8_04450, partial [Patescibacteria group bacterium]